MASLSCRAVGGLAAGGASAGWLGSAPSGPLSPASSWREESHVPGGLPCPPFHRYTKSQARPESAVEDTAQVLTGRDAEERRRPPAPQPRTPGSLWSVPHRGLDSPSATGVLPSRWAWEGQAQACGQGVHFARHLVIK